VALELIKGSGSAAPGERAAATLRRDRSLARLLARTSGKPTYRIEALAFAFGLVPVLLRRRPDVVYLSEWDTARMLAWLRPRLGLQFKLLLCNGGFAERAFDHLDRVQELTPVAREHVIRLGDDPRRHTVLPLGFRIDRLLEPPGDVERRSLRSRLGLPADRRIVLSVAALNRHHKRLDYLIDEVANLQAPRPFLMLVGEPEAETQELRAYANRRLGEEGFSMRTVRSEQVGEIYRASDVFVLASLAEAQGRVLVEAMAHGLPCVAHESAVMRFALGEHGLFGDFTRPGALTTLLVDLPQLTAERARAAHRHVYERFSWDRLRPSYVELLREVASANSTVSSSTGEKVPRYSR